MVPETTTAKLLHVSGYFEHVLPERKNIASFGAHGQQAETTYSTAQGSNPALCL